jgi:hypothetical protein
MKKRLISVTTALLTLLCMLSACGNAETTAADVTEAATTAAVTTTAAAATTKAATTTSAATTAAVDSAEITVTETAGEIFPVVAFQQYTETSTVEYIVLSADFDDYTPGMIEMNDAIYDGVGLRIEEYEDVLEAAENDPESDFGGVLVFGYSFTDKNFIQIYNTVLEYPAYGTSGDIYGYVYDIANDDYITLDEFLEGIGTDNETLIDEITAIYSDANPDVTIGDISIKTFYLAQDPDGEYIYAFLFEMVTNNADGDPWKHFFMYTPYDADVFELNSEQLFDPSSVDVYDPPLQGQETPSE